MAPHTQRVAVIGAGISGVVAAGHLRKEGIDVTVFERSNAAGGVCPCYSGLKNNVGTRLLETTLNRFPTDTPDFVTHDVLEEYIQDTAVRAGVHDVTKYDTEVRNVTKNEREWVVETSTLRIDPSGGIFQETCSSEFDAVVVASGHYHSPRLPDIHGLAEWKRRWPDRIQHSKSYRRPEEFQGKNFLLIGGGVSATDIARELAPTAQTIYQSSRNGAFDLSANLLPENGIRIAEVISFNTGSSESSEDSDSSQDSSNSKISSSLATQEPIPATIALRSGQTLCDIHHVILCTGYHPTLPFLPHLHSDETAVDKANESLLVTDGSQFHNLHQDIFYIKDPSLAFVGVPFFTATFTLFEFQAMVVAKVLSGRAKLPSEQVMRAEYEERVKTKGYGKAFHSLRNQEEEYVNGLLDWVNKDLDLVGEQRLEGYTEQWKTAREEQVQRVKALYAVESTPGRKLEVTCCRGRQRQFVEDIRIGLINLSGM
ncbi:dimethylaniline monooxygenase [Dothidotthia symphoricarpi CBS 119687]|uniref:Dimethylaniline monooxygenase n=1 Tax=Dothidotthia symphoricarpi CBS 119687 TaxID=1392245 RepID=A0A6A6A3Y8_9PLEO|nr:dimethylaniline monooxygenase [Dothidotthia symphoricarpi CBS 119687]KAF2125458.1 dimethylaniline monooxygenase [Dothidotthia symphoricarpi CBS 119687]